ncbi:Molybdate-binding protein ModA [Myxococcaceae bacterium]|nr:Molybdate-binding protein ModA [Myxococcaceae bacterium]
MHGGARLVPGPTLARFAVESGPRARGSDTSGRATVPVVDGEGGALRMMRCSRVLRSACLAGLVIAGSLRSAPADAGELLVGAAASLREPMVAIAREFEAAEGVRVALVFGASSALAAQARAGAPLDVLASADERTVAYLERARLASPDDRHVFATNRLVAVLRPGLEGRIAKPRDLAGAAVERFAIPPDPVPAGHYAREWLGRAGLLDALLPRMLATEDVRAALAAVAAGHADAALVYATDVALQAGAVATLEIPQAEQPRIVYVATRLDGSPRSAEAGRFLRFLETDAGRAALRAAGFGPAPTAASRPAPVEGTPVGHVPEAAR